MVQARQDEATRRHWTVCYVSAHMHESNHGTYQYGRGIGYDMISHCFITLSSSQSLSLSHVKKKIAPKTKKRGTSRMDQQRLCALDPSKCILHTVRYIFRNSTDEKDSFQTKFLDFHIARGRVGSEGERQSGRGLPSTQLILQRGLRVVGSRKQSLTLL